MNMGKKREPVIPQPEPERRDQTGISPGFVSWIKCVARYATAGALFYLWKFMANDMAGNLLLFWLWIVVVLGTLSIFLPATRDLPPRSKGLRRFACAMDIAVVAALAAYAHFIVAAGYIVGMTALSAYFKRCHDLAEVK